MLEDLNRKEISLILLRTTGAVSNVTGGIAGGLSLLTGDKEYMEERGKKNKKKARGLLQGLGMGAKSLVGGVAKGVTGVVSQPIKGAKKKGIKGFLGGVAKGVGGLVAKPVVGVLDSVSKTAEVKIFILNIFKGISNTKLIHVEERKRVRPQRVLYGVDRIIKTYSYSDIVYLKKFINKRNKLKSQKKSYNKEYLILSTNNMKDDEGNYCYVAMTTFYTEILVKGNSAKMFNNKAIGNVVNAGDKFIIEEYNQNNVRVVFNGFFRFLKLC